MLKNINQVFQALCRTDRYAYGSWLDIGQKQCRFYGVFSRYQAPGRFDLPILLYKLQLQNPRTEMVQESKFWQTGD